MDKVVLVGAADSIGVPYTRDNLRHVGFFELFESYLLRNYEVTTLDCFHMAKNNDNDYIKKLISEDLTLADIKCSQNTMLRQCKYSGIYPYLELPKNFLESYKIYDGDCRIPIRENIKKHKTIFIYSAFVNDVLKARGISLFKLLTPGKIKKELKVIDFDLVFDELDNNLQKLIDLNSEIEIYIVGLFIPTRLKYVRRNLGEFILSVNETLNKIAQKYPNVKFVDNSNLQPEDFNNIDFHPNRLGHERIYRNLVQVYRCAHES